MGSTYQQFCPVAKAMELLDERWTMLIIRELASGSTHFNELRRGVPRMSPTLLSRRLQHLERAGVIERRVLTSDDDAPRTPEVTYRLTVAGEELRPVVEAVGAWGTRWITELGEIDLDPKLLIWDLHRNVDPGTLPDGRTVVQFRFPDAMPKERNWWLVMTVETVDVCDFDPGHDIGVTITGTLRRMVEIWRGDLSWSDALRSGTVTVDGQERLRRRVPQWFPPSRFARIPRPGPGSMHVSLPDQAGEHSARESLPAGVS